MASSCKLSHNGRNLGRYVCHVTYKNELDSNGEPLVAVGRFCLDNVSYARKERQRYDCGGLIIWSSFPKCFERTNGDTELCFFSESTCSFTNTCFEDFTNHTIAWDDYKIELLVENTDVLSNWSSWSPWSACSNTCGPGKKTRTLVLTQSSEETDCIGSCADEEMCKPYYVRGHKLDNGASPFRAVWPTRQTQGSTLVCTNEFGNEADGFWWTDLISGDKVYMGFVGDRCHMSCSSAPLERAIFTSETTTQQNNGSLANDYTEFFSCVAENWSGDPDFSFVGEKTESANRFGNYIRNNPDQGSCVKRYCYFTDTGWTDTDMHAKYSHFDCSSDSVQLENGDWLVPEGSSCTGRCDDGFRMDSQLARLTCTDLIPFGTFDTAEYEKLLTERFDYFDDAAVIAWGMTGGLWDAFEDGNTKTASKCFKITDQDCGAFPDYTGDENETGVDWNCDDGVNSGSRCEKRCIGYFSYLVASSNSPKNETECFCRGTC